MGAENASPGTPRGSVTRRVLLVAGGLTVLGVWTADPLREAPPSQRLSAAHRTSPVSTAPGRPSPDAAASARRPRASQPPGRPHAAETARAGTEPQLAVARRSPRAAAREPMRTISDGPKAIALTIDDGPNPVYTPQVLQVLARYRVTATFSMIGIEAQAYPALVREVTAAGHLVANHTWTHLNLTWLPPALVTDQMSRGTDAIHAATGRTPDLFRAPYGAWSPFVLEQCAATGMTPLGWSVDPRDWSRPGVPAIVANIMGNTRTGSIILEHDGGGDRSETVAALKIVIPRLLAAGYHFRTP